MIKNTEYWIERWQKSKNFTVEKDRIKPKSYLFTSFPKTNLYGFQDGNIRCCLVGDFFSRFKRMLGYNVLFPVGYDSLGIQAFMENKKHSNSINDDISNIFRSQLLKLGIGIDEQKEIDLRHDSYLASLQSAFIELYNRNYIKYGKINALRDNETKKYYDTYFKNKGRTKTNIEGFYLDISTIFPILERKIDELYVGNDIKNKLYQILESEKNINVLFSVTNGTSLMINLKDYVYMGGISFICLNPDQIDFSLYTRFEEYAEIEQYLAGEYLSFGAFTGNYAINPLTGKKIPIFISDKFKGNIYVGIPAINDSDYQLALDNGLEIINVVENDKIINSDFINGYNIAEAKELLAASFIEADIATISEHYSKDKILLSSADAFGALIPFLIDDSKNLYSLEMYLPFKFSAHFRPILDEKIDVNGSLIEGSINHIFSSGMLAILALLYDDIGAIGSIFSDETLKLLQEWNGIDLAIINESELFENVFFPLCILAIIENEKRAELPALFHQLITIKPTCDCNFLNLSRFNNNLFDIERYLNQYKGDAIRLYFLKANLDDEFIFEEVQLERCANLIKGIEDFFLKPFVEKNTLDYQVNSLAKECIELFNDGKVLEYIMLILDFYKTILWKSSITKNQALIILKLLYPIIPFVCEDLYEVIFNSKYLLLDDGLNM